ncbi:MAG TPA: FAD binding domain-containing protein [Rectinemataceae bacterium]|nr:FAD binding domain-containing protein [Rectinemataceae bacterium]
MKTVQRYVRPPDLGQALKLAKEDPGAVWLAGGTILLAGDYAGKPASVVDVGPILGRGIERRDGRIEIGAGVTFQDLAESEAAPPMLREAALGIGSRNVRNRATVGGNIAANRPCSALIPALLVLDARLAIAGERGSDSRSEAELASYLAAPSGLILSVSIPERPSRRHGYARWARTANDAAVLVAAVSFTVEGPAMKDVKIAMGGIAGEARRLGELERRFEGFSTAGRPIDDVRNRIEEAAAGLLVPAEQPVVSAAFRKVRGAALLAQAVAEALAGKVGPR